MNGILIIDKPSGPTSHDVVSSIRQSLNKIKVGHTGTLDPSATGVLPLVIGKATKISRYLSGVDKLYDATICLGITTDTLDSQGKILKESKVNISENIIPDVIKQFIGHIEQIPPMYSAKKMKGKRLYKLARQGIEIEREPKKINIYSIDISSIDLPHIMLKVHCSAGTYLRVLAADIGEKIGCGAHLKTLRRLRVGAFDIKNSLKLSDSINDIKKIQNYLIPLKKSLDALNKIVIPQSMIKMIVDGYQISISDLKTLEIPNFHLGEPLVLVSKDNDLIAVSRPLASSYDLDNKRLHDRILKTECVLYKR